MSKKIGFLAFAAFVACSTRDTSLVPDPDPSVCDDRCASAGGACTVDGVCLITCAGGACGNRMRCPAGQRCEVECVDAGACSGGVSCGDATSCLVTCRGEAACGNEIECGDGPCLVECTGAGSCSNGTTCGAACACDVICTGLDSCGDSAVCPSGCEDGRGCDPAIAGCDRCS